MAAPIRVVHFINQFFAGLGGQEAIHAPLEVRTGPVGPGKALDRALAGRGEVVATLVCGDGHFNEHVEPVVDEGVRALTGLAPDVLVLGPAFDSGVYGLNCARFGNAIAERLGIPVVCGMFPENPGVAEGRRRMFIVPTGRSVGAMPKAIQAIAELVARLGTGVPLGAPDEAGYLARGVRLNRFAADNGAERAVEMLVAKVSGRPYVTEIPLPEFERIAAAPPVADLSAVTLALVTTGGIVPKGNPDRLESRRATGWRKYSIAGMAALSAADFECIHGGFDGRHANEDPNRVVPLDVMRALEREGRVGRLAPEYYVTTGNAGPLDRARRFGQDMARDLSAAGVGAVVLTAT
jgi:glycine reductase